MAIKKTKLLLDKIEDIEFGAKHGLMQVNIKGGGNHGTPGTPLTNGGPMPEKEISLVDQLNKVNWELFELDGNIYSVTLNKNGKFSAKEQENLIKAFTAKVQSLITEKTEIIKKSADGDEQSKAIASNEKSDKATLEVQKKTNSLAEKSIDLKTLDVNEMKAFSIIEKYELFSPEKFQELAQKAKAGDVDAIKSVKVLHSALVKDGKFKGAVSGTISDDLQAATGAFISENAEAILKYAETMKALKGLSTGGLVPTSNSTQNLETELKK